MNTCDPVYLHPFPIETFKNFNLLECAMFLLAAPKMA